jgi:hypothetical protein
MDINELIAIVKKKLTDQIDIESIEIEINLFFTKIMLVIRKVDII